jgi:hypothetical protein
MAGHRPYDPAEYGDAPAPADPWAVASDSPAVVVVDGTLVLDALRGMDFEGQMTAIPAMTRGDVEAGLLMALARERGLTFSSAGVKHPGRAASVAGRRLLARLAELDDVSEVAVEVATAAPDVMAVALVLAVTGDRGDRTT